MLYISKNLLYNCLHRKRKYYILRYNVKKTFLDQCPTIHCVISACIRVFSLINRPANNDVCYVELSKRIHQSSILNSSVVLNCFLIVPVFAQDMYMCVCALGLSSNFSLMLHVFSLVIIFVLLNIYLWISCPGLY